MTAAQRSTANGSAAMAEKSFEIELDLNTIKAREVGAFFAALNSHNIDKLAGYLVTMATACSWGPHDQIDTYLDAPYGRLIKAVIAAYNDAEKNLLS